MRKLIISIGLILTNCLFCLSQNTGQSEYFNGRTKILIEGFYQMPPGCGIENNVSIYEAVIIDSLNVSFGKKILISMNCRADLYSAIHGDRFVVKLLDYMDDSGYKVYNFTTYNDLEIKKMKKYSFVYFSKI